MIEACICGRLLRPAHCPYCGSVNLSGLKRMQQVDEATGVVYTGHTCRRCARQFNTSYPCGAPPPPATKDVSFIASKAKKSVEAAPPQMKEALRAVLKKRGVDPGNIKFASDQAAEPESEAQPRRSDDSIFE